MQLFLIRHADPDYDRDSLTSAGKLEAEALALRMASAIRPDFLFSSPSGRARETMHPTEAALGMSGLILKWTGEVYLRRECNGESQAMAPKRREPVTLEEDVRISRKPIDLQFPFDETKLQKEFVRVSEASDAFLLAQGYRRTANGYRFAVPSRKKLAIFCHNRLAITWLAHLLDIPLRLMWSAFWLPPSSVTTILFEERTPDCAAPLCTGLGDVSHLLHPGLQRSSAGLDMNQE
jgi:broad specificity phosphatase PhoE